MYLYKTGCWNTRLYSENSKRCDGRNHLCHPSMITFERLSFLRTRYGKFATAPKWIVYPLMLGLPVLLCLITRNADDVYLTVHPLRSNLSRPATRLDAAGVVPERTDFFLDLLTGRTREDVDVIYLKSERTGLDICSRSDKDIALIVNGLVESYFVAEILVRCGAPLQSERDLFFSAAIEFVHCVNPTMSADRYRATLEGFLPDVCKSILSDPGSLYRFFPRMYARYVKLTEYGTARYDEVTEEEEGQIAVKMMKEDVNPHDWVDDIQALYETF